jgi:hypothetical protein
MVIALTASAKTASPPISLSDRVFSMKVFSIVMSPPFAQTPKWLTPSMTTPSITTLLPAAAATPMPSPEIVMPSIVVVPKATPIVLVMKSAPGPTMFTIDAHRPRISTSASIVTASWYSPAASATRPPTGAAAIASPSFVNGAALLPVLVPSNEAST